MKHTMGRMALALTAGCLLTFAGCGGGKSEPNVEETGKDLSKNPFAAAGQMADAAKEMSEKMQEAAARKPVDPVSFNALLPFLPAPAGYEADKPEGNTTTMGEFKVTVVSNRFSKALGADETVSIDAEITDGGYVPMVYAPFLMMSKFSNESTEGYQKGVTVDGNPGYETWRIESKEAELSVLVADRFLVHLRSAGTEPALLREVVGTMRLGELRKLGG